MKKLLAILLFILICNAYADASRMSRHTTEQRQQVQVPQQSRFIKFNGYDSYYIDHTPAGRPIYKLNEEITDYRSIMYYRSIEKGWSDKFPTIILEPIDISEKTQTIYYRLPSTRDADFNKLLRGY